MLEAPVQDNNPCQRCSEVRGTRDLNSPGDQSDRTSRKVAENTKAGQSIGAPVQCIRR